MTDIHVSNADELWAALSDATGGETILLEAGDYGDLALNFNKEAFVKFQSEVTIRSADLADPAAFASLHLRGVENLSFDSILFDYNAEFGSPEWEKPYQIDESNGISITNSIFDGDLASGVDEYADGFGSGFGLVVSRSVDVSVSGNEFHNWTRAATFGSVEDLVVFGNEVHDIRADGFDFADVDRVLIENNYLHDFRRADGDPYHSDMIQFWTNGTTTPTTDVTIRGNILDSGGGPFTQSIFMRNDQVDQGLAGAELFFQNILIEHNVIRNAQAHGIHVGESNGLTIQHNTILHNPDSGDNGLVNVPTISVADASLGVVVANNIVPRLDLTPSSELTLTNNLIVQRDNPEAANYYGDLFVDALADSLATVSGLNAVPGGIIEQLGVGSSLTLFDTTPDSPTGFLLNDPGTGLELYAHDFDASNLYGPSGQIDLTGATVVWDYGDGSAGSGTTSAHTFAQAGDYVVRATITLSGGETVVVEKSIIVETPVALHADFNSGADDLSDSVNVVSAGGGVTYEAGQDGNAVRLNGDVVTYDASPEFFNNSEYTVLFDFRKDVGNESGAGRAVYFSSSFVITVEADGITANVITDAGNETLQASGIGIDDADWHQVALTFSGEDGTVTLYVDGIEVGQVSGLDGAVQVGSTSHDMHIGNPFGPGFPGLIDNVAFLRGAITAEQAAGGFRVDDLLAPADPFNGTDGDDTINGDDQDNTINGNDGDDWIDGGLGADTLFGGAGNDTIVFDASDNLAALNGGAGTDTLRINDGSLPVFDLAAHSFEFAEHVQSDAGGATWATKTDRYDAAWTQTSQEGVNDDGSTWQTEWDVNAQNNWATRTDRYDSSGNRYQQTGTYDDGRTWQTVWDLTTSEPWSREMTFEDVGDMIFWNTLELRFDDSNRLYERVELLDDGGVNTIEWDVAGTELWARQITSLDQSSLYNWTSSARRYDDQDRLYDQTGTYDDGRTWHTRWDVDGTEAWAQQTTYTDVSGIKSWDTLTFSFDDLDRLQSRAEVRDSGEAFLVEWDVADAEAWSRQVLSEDLADLYHWTNYVARYDDQNRLYEESGTNDDGRVWSTQWDVSGSEAWGHELAVQDTTNDAFWSTLANRYDDLGRLYERNGEYDDGRTWQTTWDVDNTETWHRETRISDTADNHAWSEQIYEYDESGVLLNLVVIDDAVV